MSTVRSRTVRNIRCNFPYLTQDGNTLCPLCETCSDTQEHILECPVLGSASESVLYSHVWGSVEEQKELATEYNKRIQRRTELVESTVRCERRN